MSKKVPGLLWLLDVIHFVFFAIIAFATYFIYVLAFSYDAENHLMFNIFMILAMVAPLIYLIIMTVLFHSKSKNAIIVNLILASIFAVLSLASNIYISLFDSHTLWIMEFTFSLIFLLIFFIPYLSIHIALLENDYFN